jgi:hypothetical protein
VNFGRELLTARFTSFDPEPLSAALKLCNALFTGASREQTLWNTAYNPHSPDDALICATLITTVRR